MTKQYIEIFLGKCFEMFGSSPELGPVMAGNHLLNRREAS